MTTYKIYDTENGLFANAGLHRFTKFGKTWSMEGSLKSALTHRFNSYWAKRNDLHVPDSWLVMEFSANGVHCYPAKRLHERPAKK